MAVVFHRDEGLDLLVASASGVVTAEDVIAGAERVFKESRGAAFYQNHLFEIEKDAVGSLIDLKALFRIRRFLEEWGEKYPGRNVRTVFLVPDRTALTGVIDVWHAVTKEASNFKVDIRIMNDRSAAIAWLTDGKKKSA
jgi:hypothetical protein